MSIVKADSENDKAVAADMIRKGYIISNEDGLNEANLD